MKRLLLLLMLVITPTLVLGQNNNNPPAPDVEETFFSVAQPYMVKLLKGVEGGTEFILDEAPIIIKQYVLFNAVYYSIIIIIAFIFVFFSKYIAIALFTKKGAKDEDGEYGMRYDGRWHRISKTRFIPGSVSDWSGEQVCYFFTRWGLKVAGVMMILVNLTTAIKATFFPKLFLVEKFIELGTSIL